MKAKLVEPHEILEDEYTDSKKEEDIVYNEFFTDLRSKKGFFIWAPSSSRNPRTSHMAFYGRTYSYKDGAGEEGILPAEEFGCKCGIIELPENKKDLIGIDANLNEKTNTIKIAGTTFLADTKDVINNKLTNLGYKKYQKAVRLGGGALKERQKSALSNVFVGGQYLKKLSFVSQVKTNKFKVQVVLYNPSTQERSKLSYFLSIGKGVSNSENGLFITKSRFNEEVKKIEKDTKEHVVTFGGLR